MQTPFYRSLSYRFTSQAAVASIAASLIFTLILIGIDYRLSQTRIFEDTQALLQSSSQTSQLAVYNLDKDMTQTITTGLVDYPAIVYAVMVDNNGKIIARARRSPELSRYRWISDALLGNNITLKQELREPVSQNFLGYLLIEIDSFILGKRFLQRASLLFFGSILLAALIALLLLLLHRRHLTKPLQSICLRLAEIDPKAPEAERLVYPPHHDLDEIGVLVAQINKLLTSITTHAARRDRAESDLRKNLSSVEAIVTERTEALRSTSQRLQQQLENGQQQLLTHKQAQHNWQTQQQQIQQHLLLCLSFARINVEQLNQPQLTHLQRHTLCAQLLHTQQQMQQQLLPEKKPVWLSDNLEMTLRNLALLLSEQGVDLHASFENSLAASWQVALPDLLWLVEQITLEIADFTPEISPQLHVRGRLNSKHQVEKTYLQITWHLSNSSESLQPLLENLLAQADARSQAIAQRLQQHHAILRLSTHHSQRVRLLIPVTAAPGPNLKEWAAPLSQPYIKKVLLIWCEAADVLRHLQNTLRGLNIGFETLQIEADASLGEDIQPLARAPYHGCITNHTEIAARLRQQSQLPVAELVPWPQALDNTYLGYPLRQQEVLQRLISWLNLNQ